MQHKIKNFTFSWEHHPWKSSVLSLPLIVVVLSGYSRTLQFSTKKLSNKIKYYFKTAEFNQKTYTIYMQYFCEIQQKLNRNIIPVERNTISGKKKNHILKTDWKKFFKKIYSFGSFFILKSVSKKKKKTLHRQMNLTDFTEQSAKTALGLYFFFNILHLNVVMNWNFMKYFSSKLVFLFVLCPN